MDRGSLRWHEHPAIWFGTALPVTIALVGVLLMIGWPGFAPPTWLARAALYWFSRSFDRGPALAFGSLLGVSGGSSPDLAAIGSTLRRADRSGRVFLARSGSDHATRQENARGEAAAIVIRIADAAPESRHQDVKPQLGKWCEGYVTIRGTWCEPLSIDLTNRLNHRLAEVTCETAGKAPS